MARSSLFWSLLFLVPLTTTSAWAQDDTFTLNTEHARFDATGTGMSVASSPRTLELFQFGGGFTIDVSDKALALWDGAFPNRELVGEVLQSKIGIDVRGVIGFEHADLAIILPVNPVVVWGQDPTGGNFPTLPGDSASIGDLVIIPKVRAVDIRKNGVFGFGVQVPVSLPTGQTERYAGDGLPTVAVDLLAEIQAPSIVRAVFNVAPIHIRPRKEWDGAVRFIGMDWKAGLAITPATGLDIQIEGWGTVAYLGTAHQATAEVAASIKLRPNDFVTLVLGGGTGLGFGVPAVRAFAGVSFPHIDQAEFNIMKVILDGFHVGDVFGVHGARGRTCL